MGRLFWKFFLFIWLAQLIGMAGIGVTFWLKHRTQNESIPGIDLSPPAAFVVGSAAATLHYGGVEALRSLMNDRGQPRIYAIDEHQQEILQRAVPAATLVQARLILSENTHPHAVQTITAADGHRYLLFVPRPDHGHADGRADGRPPDASPHPGPSGMDRPDGFDRRPPHGEPPMFPIEPLLATLFVSLLCAALLARYFSKPIRSLRSAFDAAAAGNLEARLGPIMGNRRDELADLGRDFDHMAGQLHTLMESQRRLLHDVSHELRSPLARLQAAIGLARQKPENLAATMDRLELESVHIDHLVGELLTLSRLEAGVTGALQEEVNMGELVADIMDDARFEAEAQGRTVEFSGNCEVIVEGREELLYRAIENVVRNAIRHTPEGSLISVEAEYRPDRHDLLLCVLDNGPGIPEAELGKIFEPFFRGSGTKSTDGYGLGLAIAQRVVQAHGGTIYIANRAQGGLSVGIALPVKRIGTG